MINEKTLRDEFAMAALSALIIAYRDRLPDGVSSTSINGWFANRAISYADALLAARAQTND